MFTGLIEDLGALDAINRGTNSAQLRIKTKLNLEELSLGDSIAVNGVCLTVTAKSANAFLAEVMWETLKRTNLGDLKAGDRVNLERALRLDGRLDGHLVSGHVDGTGIIAEKQKLDIAEILTVKSSPALLHYLLPKGSIAVDGISLTVVDVLDEAFSVSLIPHTRDQTTLGLKILGDMVNLEVDMLAKYVERFINRSKDEKQNSGITYEQLLENGFA